MPDQFHFVLWVKFIRNWMLYLRSLWDSTFVPREWPHRVNRTVRVLNVPIGYARQELLDQKAMQDRQFHCFFAGQVNLKLPLLRRLTPSPKVLARRKMLAVIGKMVKKDRRFRFDGGEAMEPRITSQVDSDNYSERMMNSKICVAPRGTAVDTFRFFEGLRAGCLVVCEHLTDEWYYAGAPVLRVKDWADLPEAIAPYLYDDEALERARIQSLTWWTEVCGEKAVGRAMAEYLMSTGKHFEKRDARTIRSREKGSVLRERALEFGARLRRCIGDRLETF